MPTYEFLCPQNDCNHEWEDFLSITAENPTHCPKCGQEGNIIKLISGGSGKGIVQLEGQDLVDHCKADGKRIQAEASQNANKYASLLGEDKYHALQTKLDRRGR